MGRGRPRGWRRGGAALPAPNAEPLRWARQAEVSRCCLIKSGRTLIPPAVPLSLSSSALGLWGDDKEVRLRGGPCKKRPGWEDGLPPAAPEPPPRFTVAPGVPPARCPHRVTPEDGTSVPPAPRCGSDAAGTCRGLPGAGPLLSAAWRGAGAWGYPGGPSWGPLAPELLSGTDTQARRTAWGPSSTPAGAVGEGWAVARHACSSRLGSPGSRGTRSLRVPRPAPEGGGGGEGGCATTETRTPSPEPQGHNVGGPSHGIGKSREGSGHPPTASPRAPPARTQPPPAGSGVPPSRPLAAGRTRGTPSRWWGLPRPLLPHLPWAARQQVTAGRAEPVPRGAEHAPRLP